MSRARSGDPGTWFDVEALRGAGHRVAVQRRVARPAVVLGSTQDEAVVDRWRAAQAGYAVTRRRTGGGAVLVAPGEQLWLDVWLPRGDPLFDDDVARAASWVGRWWAGALRGAGLAPADGLAVHEGPPVRAEWSSLVCFAGLGPGEVRAGGAKVVGVAQWRGREGALFHTAAYRRWDPGALVDLLDAPDGQRAAMRASLAAAAVGLDEMAGRAVALPALTAALTEALPDGPLWEVTLA